jgi:phospholipid/cholesterol/gamma-HCH transport system substrate-binding protein
MSRNSVTYGAVVKLTIFAGASVLVTGLLVMIMGNYGFGSTRSYRAEFANASMLASGDDVRVAGVVVGSVKNVELVDETFAEVEFAVSDDLTLTRATTAEIRYANLIGDRYVALEEGQPSAEPLPDDALIPRERTQPALDLGVLFNGFRPLFAALSPEDVNELSLNLVRTLQGEGGTVESVLAHTASLTSTLADRDQLIGRVVDNLDEVLGTVDSRNAELDVLLTEVRRWAGGLARDRKAIGSSIASLGDLTRTTADLLNEGRPSIQGNIAELRALATTLSSPENKKMLDKFLRTLPGILEDQARTASYGSWYNFYLCSYTGRITLPVLSGPGAEQLQQELNDLTFHSSAARCR